MAAPRTWKIVTSLATSLATTVALASLAHANVLVVGPSPSDFTSLPAAVQAASSGDLLLVKSGTYAGFTVDAKTLTVLADTGSTVQLSSTVRVQNLTASQSCVLSGLAITSASSPALIASNVQGSLRIQSSTLRVSPSLAMGAVPAVTLTNCANAALADCFCYGASPAQSFALAGEGIRASNVKLALENTLAQGGSGAPGTWGTQAPGGVGGVGLTLASGELCASTSTLRGGPGGFGGVQSTGLSGCAGQAALPGGAGGAGIEVAAAAVARLSICEVAGGAGGGGGTTACGAHGAIGSIGARVVGTAVESSGAARLMHAARVAREGASATFAFDGEPGDRVFLFIANDAGFQYQSALGGCVLVHNPFQRRVFLGTIPSGGVLTAALTIPELGANVSSVVRHVQAVSIDVASKGHLGAVGVLALLDRSL